MLSDIIYSEHAGNLKLLLKYLFNSIDSDGKWEDSRSYWTPMSTTFAVDLMLDIGLELNDEWHVKVNNEICKFSLKKSIEYLNSQIHENGRFGTDLWDAVKLANLIVRHNLISNFKNYKQLNTYIFGCIKSNSILNKDEHWSGPSFYSTIIDYLDLIGEVDLSNEILNTLISFQNRNGSWAGFKNKAKEYIISPIFDTSQVILTLNRKDDQFYSAYLKKAFSYIIKTQEVDGGWKSSESYEVLYTSWATLALSCNLKNQLHINNAIGFLTSKISDDGKCMDLLGTIMSAKVLWNLLCHDLNDRKKFKEYILNLNKLESINFYEKKIGVLEETIKQMNIKLYAFENKYNNAEIVLSKNKVFFLSLLLALIALLGSIPLLIGFYNNYNSNVPNLDRQDSTKVSKSNSK